MSTVFERFKNAVMGTLSEKFPTLASSLVYFYAKHKWPDFSHPRTLDEKIQWLKLNEYRDNPLVTQCADKLAVRDYVEACGLGDTLNELLGVYENAADIDFSALPQRFAAKCNHGCGYNIICSDKTKLDEYDFIDKLDTWIREDYWKKRAELNYKDIKKRIIIESFLDSGGASPEDYKIYCFNGKPMYLMLCENRGVSGKPSFYFVDRNWKLARLNKDSIVADESFVPEKPVCSERLWEYAEILAKPFPFVRADFYVVGDKPIFGELTFTPCSAADPDRLKDTDFYFGSLLDIGK